MVMKGNEKEEDCRRLQRSATQRQQTAVVNKKKHRPEDSTCEPPESRRVRTIVSSSCSATCRVTSYHQSWCLPLTSTRCPSITPLWFQSAAFLSFICHPSFISWSWLDGDDKLLSRARRRVQLHCFVCRTLKLIPWLNRWNNTMTHIITL